MAQPTNTVVFVLLFTAVAIVSPSQSWVSIGFERAKYSFAEDSGFHIAYLTKSHVNRALRQTFSIRVEVE